MGYTALYRKFRPDNFDSVRGQDHIVTTLRNQIKADRIGHAYLFCGTRGTGKTTVAKILAKAVNCEHPVDGSPCCECEACRAIASGSNMDVREIDAASNNSVDNIRGIIEEVAYTPSQGKKRVYIVDEVHMLSNSAFNALLKTLEEPPEYVMFILATTEPNSLPVTILSRCQKFEFRRISTDTIADRMRELMEEEKVSVQDRALKYIAKCADGSLRDALSLLDQCIAFNFGEELTYDRTLSILGAVDTDTFAVFLKYIQEGDVPGSIGVLDRILLEGRELSQFCTDFTWYLRNLMLLKASDDMEEVIDMSSEGIRQLCEAAGTLAQDTVIRYIQTFAELSAKLRDSSQKRVLLETTIVRLCRPRMEKSREAILDRIRSLEKKLEQRTVIAAGGAVYAGSAAGGAVYASPAEKEAPAASFSKELVKASAGEVKAIVRDWKRLAEKLGGPGRPALRQSKVRIEGTNTLVISFPDEFGLMLFTSEDEDRGEKLKELIRQEAQRDVDVIFENEKEAQPAEKPSADISALIEGIDFDVEFED